MNRSILRSSVGTALALALAFGCGTAVHPPHTTTTNGTTGGNCTLPSTISTNLTLDGSCNPWRVTSGGTLVEGAAIPVLTIDPGVTVAFDQGATLGVGVNGPGGLHAVGTPSAHITFTSSAALPKAGDWAAVELFDNTLQSSEVGYADFDLGAGGWNSANGYAGPQGALITDSSTTPFQVLLHDLTFSHNGGNGLVMNGFGVGFAKGSGQLAVNDWASGSAPFVVTANEAGTLPSSLTAPPQSNGSPAVVDLIDGDASPGSGGGAWVMQTQTWPSLSLPYLLDGQTQGTGSQGVQSGINIEGNGSSVATLTIAGPNTLELRDWGSIEVDPQSTGQGNLVVSSGVTFTSLLAPKQAAAGSWSGIHFHVTSAGLAGSSLTGVTVEGAGGNWTIGSASLSGSIFLDGPVTVPTSQAIGPSITGSSILAYPSGDCGIIAGGISQASLSSYTAASSANTFGDPSNTVCGD